jgi:hypothetical protein
MKAIYDGGSTYCVPTSLSAVTGVGTKKITEIIQKLRKNKRKVTGVSVMEIKQLFNLLKIEAEPTMLPGDRIRLSKWATYIRQKGVVYLVLTRSHMMVIRDSEVICTQFKGCVGPLGQSKFLKSEIRMAYAVKNPATVNEIVTQGAERIKGNPMASFRTSFGTIGIFSGSV